MKGGAGDNEIGKEGDRKKRFPALYEHDIAIGLFFFSFFFLFFSGCPMLPLWAATTTGKRECHVTLLKKFDWLKIM